MLETYYASKEILTRIRQKSSDLRRIVQTALERNRKKLILQQKQMKDTAKKINIKYMVSLSIHMDMALKTVVNPLKR